MKNSTNKLGEMPIFKLLIAMTIPGLISSMTNYLYRTVDAIFVGNYVGTEALGGIGILAPYNNIIIAATFFLTVGGASILSLTLGRKDYDKANALFTNVIIQAVLMSVIISVIFFIFAKPFVILCGAPEGTQIFNYAYRYLRIVAIGLLFNMLNQGLAAIIRAEGNAKYAMFASAIGAIINIFLDWLLIVKMGMGIEGAAIATIGSQILGAIISFVYFFTGKSVLKWKNLKVVNFVTMLTIAKMGLAPSVYQFLAFFINILLNNSLQRYGDLDAFYKLIGGGELCISAFAAVNSVDFFIIAVAAGINQAVAPILGYNYGAELFKRVREATIKSQLLTIAMTSVIWAMMMLIPAFLINLFAVGDESFVKFGVVAMRTAKVFSLFAGYQMLVSMYFSATGRPKIATFTSFVRNGLFLIPALIILPKYYGLMGVLYAQAVSDGCSLIVVSILYGKELFKLKEQEKEKVVTSCDLNIAMEQL